jgi:hypothetical protein
MIEPTPLLLIGLLADPAGSHPQPSATATATALTVADASKSPRPARWPGALT